MVAVAALHLRADRQRTVRRERDAAARADERAVSQDLGAVADDPSLEGRVRPRRAPDLDLGNSGVAGVAWYAKGHSLIMRGFAPKEACKGAVGARRRFGV